MASNGFGKQPPRLHPPPPPPPPQEQKNRVSPTIVLERNLNGRLIERERNSPIRRDLMACCGPMDTARCGMSPQLESRSATPLPLSLDNTVPFSQPETEGPNLLHSIHHTGSILSLAASSNFVYAGTQDGEICVWGIELYELRARLKAHQGSVLSLTLSKDTALLFSTGGDAIVNVWDANSLKIIYSMYSTYDVGDIFCLTYSSIQRTAYFGAQNTSIQWCNLDSLPRPTLTFHPSQRNHRFFDSKGPGGTQAPRPHSGDAPEDVRDAMYLEVDPKHIIQYAHYGYVYCMLIVRGIGGGEDEMLISGGGDGDVKLWRIEPSGSELKEVQRLEGGDASVLSIAVQDNFLYCGLADGDINVWDLETYQLIRSVQAHRGDILTISVSDNHVLTGSATGYIRKWNNRFECVSYWKGHEGLVLASIVSPADGHRLLATGGNDNTLSVWDISCNEVLKTFSEAQNDQMLSALGKLISFRTVSGDPSYTEECRRGASYLRSLFRRFGAQTELLPAPDNRNPVVFAKFKGSHAESRKTILFYGHYDVIAAKNVEGKWDTDPFTLTGVNGYLYGRGVSDNKGPTLAALYAVGELVQEGKLEADIVFLIEGEEEHGSRGFAEAVHAAKEIIGPVDWILLANSYWLDDETPCLTYGLRGVIHATVTVESELPDLHSGVDGSYLNHEPTIDLVNLLAKLTSVDGEIRIPDFYTPVRPVTPAEEAMYSAIVRSFQKSSPSISASSLKARLMSKWRFPSHTIHRITVSGPSNATIIPRSASAAISLRIVPDQDLAIIKASLRDFLTAQFASFSSNNRLQITIDHEAEPWLGSPENRAFQTLEAGIREVWGVEKPLYIREGGSIPAARFLEKEFGAQAAHLPCGQSSDHAHLDNERLRLLNLYRSKEILKRAFGELPRE